MNDTTDTGAALRLIELCSSTRELPQPVLERAKVCLLDALGCGLVGSHGTPADPCTYAEVVDKLRRLAAFSAVGDADTIVRIVESIDGNTRTRELSRALRATR